ncbi:PAS domain S-box protein [Zoogloea sp. LCSB751]|uniref:PAS domain S-box protein n=1 Tax=Zoogloea sp. LCSB751 TaxID=1965277 RepID=UPI001374796F|nr:PAS domain S-box protein [Zoogloea sp. LCSB751]
MTSSPDPSFPGEAEAFHTLLELASRETGVDLDRYKEGTLYRHVLRRCRLLGLATLADYLAHARTHPDELACLQHGCMVSVSSFFRDAEVFDELARSLRAMVAGLPAGVPLRAWVPACATGEEAYSIAMLLAEIVDEQAVPRQVRIFATDIDQDALELARAGRYGAAELEGLGDERLTRWFVADGDAWRVGKALRELCVFSLHDLTGHPPFIRMDLISCRNILIYFKPEQQAELIRNFHFALNPGGFLFLGKAESIGYAQALFEPVDAAGKLYRRSVAAGAAHAPSFRHGAPERVARVAPRMHARPQREALAEQARDLVVDAYGPPGVLVDANFEPLHFFGASRRYFALPVASADFSVFALVLPELRGELKALGLRMRQDAAEVLRGIGAQVRIGEETLRVRPVLRRVAGPDGVPSGAMLISFEETPVKPVPPADAGSGGLASAEAADEIARLRQELADTREHLQAVIEELEASNEELQSLNEEIQASSEELQASNEELQASNEELTTLNEALRLKSLEYVQLNTTLANIQDSIRSSLVVVDRDGRVTRFNALAGRVFGLLPGDIGQFLYGVPCYLDLPLLREWVSGVVAGQGSRVEHVQQHDLHYLVQVDPYLDEVGGNAGAVLTFTDISELRRAEDAQALSEARFRQVWDSSVEGLLVVKPDGEMLLVNPAFAQMFGYTEDELIGKPVEILVPESQRDGHGFRRERYHHSPAQAQALMSRRNLCGCRKDGSEFAIELSLGSLNIDGVDHVLATVSDVTERSLAEELLKASERRLRLALDAARAGFWEVFLESNNHYWSDELWGLYGLEPDSVTPSHEAWLDTVHPADRAPADAVIAEARAREERFEIEWQVKLPDGQPPRWLLSIAQPVRGADGRVRSYIGIVIDVSARRLAEARRRESDAMLATILDNVGAYIYIKDTDYRYTYANGAVCRLFGVEREQICGSNDDAYFDATTARTLLANDRRVIEGGERIEIEETNVDARNGETHSYISVKLPLRRDNGCIYALCGISTDITERKRAEQELLRHRQNLESLVDARTRELLQAKDAAESANRAKSAFLANMSHEIRTPLNAVLGMARIMQRDGVSPTQAEQLGKIDGAAQHLLGVINDILDLSKIEAEKFILEEGEFALDGVVDNVAAMIHDRLTAKGLHLQVQVESLPHLLRGDGTRFTQALLNLASNAVKFTEAGTILLGLRVEQRQGDALQVRAEVCDHGIGIPAEVLPKLFRPFEQGDASTTRRFGGTGLGLAITRRLAELMGGDAGVSSAVGQGSTFWFTAWLGVGRSVQQALPDDGAGECAESVLRKEYRGAQILLVEDEPVNQEVAKLFLFDAGLDVAVAGNGAVAVDMAAGSPFDLILMDMQMPEMDGLEATRRIRALPAYRQVPIIAMTANAFAEDRAQCMAAGMDDFLSKPVDPDRLFSTILRWLRRR